MNEQNLSNNSIMYQAHMSDVIDMIYNMTLPKFIHYASMKYASTVIHWKFPLFFPPKSPWQTHSLPNM